MLYLTQLNHLSPRNVHNFKSTDARHQWKEVCHKWPSSSALEWTPSTGSPLMQSPQPKTGPSCFLETTGDTTDQLRWPVHNGTGPSSQTSSTGCHFLPPLGGSPSLKWAGQTGLVLHISGPLLVPSSSCCWAPSIVEEEVRRYTKPPLGSRQGRRGQILHN